MDVQLRSKLKVDGILLFGGMDKKGRMSNDLMLFEAYGIFSKLDCKGKKWEKVDTKGIKPCPRIEHSMNLLKSKSCLVIVGGKNEKGNLLQDSWCLDLKTLIWNEISLSPPDHLRK